MLARTAAALAALHDSGARYGRSATWDEELTEVREVVARLATTVPHIGTAADPLLSRLEALHSSVPADPLVSAHHDFRPAQVLLHDGGIGFIDFDGACRAEPALDLGRFRAKLRDIGISAFCASGRPLAGDPLERHLRLMDELCDDFLAAYQRHAPVTAQRVVLWETTDLLTALLHAMDEGRRPRGSDRDSPYSCMRRGRHRRSRRGNGPWRPSGGLSSMAPGGTGGDRRRWLRARCRTGPRDLRCGGCRSACGSAPRSRCPRRRPRRAQRAWPTGAGPKPAERRSTGVWWTP